MKKIHRFLEQKRPIEESYCYIFKRNYCENLVNNVKQEKFLKFQNSEKMCANIFSILATVYLNLLVSQWAGEVYRISQCSRETVHPSWFWQNWSHMVSRVCLTLHLFSIMSFCYYKSKFGITWLKFEKAFKCTLYVVYLSTSRLFQNEISFEYFVD